MNNIENKYNRIIVKAGTSLLTGGSGQLDLTILWFPKLLSCNVAVIRSCWFPQVLWQSVGPQ